MFPSEDPLARSHLKLSKQRRGGGTCAAAHPFCCVLVRAHVHVSQTIVTSAGPFVRWGPDKRKELASSDFLRSIVCRRGWTDKLFPVLSSFCSFVMMRDGDTLTGPSADGSGGFRGPSFELSANHPKVEKINTWYFTTSHDNLMKLFASKNIKSYIIIRCGGEQR